MPTFTPDALALRLMTLVTAVLVVAQTAVGMVVNLYVTVPVHHPGAEPGDYFADSLQSVAWALGHGQAACRTCTGASEMSLTGAGIRLLVERR
jgi:hypothetical protein